MSANRYVLITGANKGIGRASVAAILGYADDTHVFLGSRDRGRGEAAKASLVDRQPGWADRITVVELDVGSDESVSSAALVVGAALGDARLYGLVNNAGIGQSDDLARVLNVNTRGPKRMVDAFVPLLAADGRIVNVSSASGPNFVSRCSARRQQQMTRADVSWDDVAGLMDECIAIANSGGDFASAGLSDGNAYGLSKACLNTYTIALGRSLAGRTVNACTPGFIETDMTRPYATSQGISPADMGMKQPTHGTRSTTHLLFGELSASGWYFGSDAQRSPLDRYRSPGDPPYSPSDEAH